MLSAMLRVVMLCCSQPRIANVAAGNADGLSQNGHGSLCPSAARRALNRVRAKRAAWLEKSPATIRGLFNLLGRKLDIVAEFEDRVPAYVEQMFDRLEASGIIVGWDRDDWEIRTTTIGLDIRIAPRPKDAPAEA